MENYRSVGVTGIEGNVELERLLEALAGSLELPPSMGDLVRKRYGSLTDWLEREESIVKHFDPVIYPQGSFALGTVVRPLSDADEFDLDFICQLSRSKMDLTQAGLKFDIGSEIKGYVSSKSFKKQAEEWDKCWTIEYSDEGFTFKIDIVPALPDNDTYSRLIRGSSVASVIAQTAISITDSTRENYRVVSNDWPRGNPKGFAEWFKARMRVQLAKRKESYAAKSLEARAAEDVPDYKVKTPLQQSVQLLKRHRDVYFEMKEFRPSSIVLTTLAALAYDNEGSLVEAMESILSKLESGIIVVGRRVIVSNPVDPEENFADEWEAMPEAYQAFLDWLKRVRADWAALKSVGASEFGDFLSERFGPSATSRAMSTVGFKPVQNSSPILSPSTFNVSHRERPENRWGSVVGGGVSIKGFYSCGEDGYKEFSSRVTPLPKQRSLKFVARTAIPGPFKVYWQVVNTGHEAERLAGGLRGQIFPASGVGVSGLTQYESTSYKGRHWVQCFVVKYGKCVASSAPFIVNIQ